MEVLLNHAAVHASREKLKDAACVWAKVLESSLMSTAPLCACADFQDKTRIGDRIGDV